MKPVFADTSYFVALLGTSDSLHKKAIEWSESHLGRTVVTEYVLIELGNALSAKSDRSLYAPIVDWLLDDPATVYIPASNDLFQAGKDLFEARPDKEWSVVDCISFNIMNAQRIKDALTADRHFEQAGFRALLR